VRESAFDSPVATALKRGGMSGTPRVSFIYQGSRPPPFGELAECLSSMFLQFFGWPFGEAILPGRS
jgi:hypothetical protein